MVVIFTTKKGAYGFIWQFTFEDIDYSTYSAKLYVWDDLSTKIIDGKACVVAKSGTDTLVSYTVGSTDFTSTKERYNAEIEFYSGTFNEKSETFKIVIDSSHPIT
jgi:hypothetical protein